MEGKVSRPQFEANSEKKMVSRPQDHQVFISFRGAELRNNFISHLVDAFERKRINVFIDKQENKGEDINNLLKRIEESRIAIVVFSSRYTESTWCLREADKIKERADQGQLKVLPIFYKVTPTNVKHLKGKFGDYFRDREWEFRKQKFLIEKWKKALAFISGKLGLTLDDQSVETDFIASIICEVLKLLESIPSTTQAAKSHIKYVYEKGETSSKKVAKKPVATLLTQQPPRGSANVGIRPTVATQQPPRSSANVGIRPNVATQQPPRSSANVGIRPNVPTQQPPKNSANVGIRPPVAMQQPPRGSANVGIRPTVPPNQYYHGGFSYSSSFQVGPNQSTYSFYTSDFI